VPTAGQLILNNAYTKAWRKARQNTLTDAQQRSPLAKVPVRRRRDRQQRRRQPWTGYDPDVALLIALETGYARPVELEPPLRAGRSGVCAKPEEGTPA
jgi:hypothetical protein